MFTVSWIECTGEHGFVVFAITEYGDKAYHNAQCFANSLRKDMRGTVRVWNEYGEIC